MAIARLALITLDCNDPQVLATFWAGLLEGQIIRSDDQMALVQTPGGAIAAVAVPDYHAPMWPGGTTPKHMHLDLAVSDLETAEAVAVRLGARIADFQPGGNRWRVLRDPAGHPFCLTLNIPTGWTC